MSNEQERPLSRRELREREGWAAQDAEADSPHASTSDIDQALATDSVPTTTTSSIPVIGPDGRMLTRRELRELWAAEEAAALAAATAETTEAVEPAETVEPFAEIAPAAESEEPSEDVAAKVATEPESLSAVEPAIALDTVADRDEEVINDVVTEHEPLPAPEHKGFRFPWSKTKPSDQDGAGDDSVTQVEVSSSVVGAVAAGTVAAEAAASSAAIEEHAEPVDQPEPTSEPVVEAEAEVKTYSFPEVSPDPESRSIFDQHTTGTIGFVPTTEITDPSETGAFDDIITRAVADEGAASPTNTAALILPTLPDTTDLSGALNETGEIVITGSIDLPRTLGETGGHIELHDTLDPHEAVVLGHDVHDVVLEAENHTQPVSATRAVSAQASNNAIVSPVSKGDSKLPLILAISAGGLVVVVAGVFIWAASTGLFG